MVAVHPPACRTHCARYDATGRLATTALKDGITTGAANDIERASQLARSMVTKWGVLGAHGALLYDEDDGEVFLGMFAVSQPKRVSSRTAREIDEEVRAIIDECYSTAKQILGEPRGQAPQDGRCARGTRGTARRNSRRRRIRTTRPHRHG